MMTLLLSTSFMITMLMIFVNHPLSMGLILLIQSILITLITGLMTYNFWFSYMMFIIMIGGMLVLFIYMTSIASNEMFKMSMNLMIMSTMILLTFMLTNMITEKYFISYKIKKMDLLMINTKEQFLYSINKFINMPYNLILMFLIIYLFITLIAVMKIIFFLNYLGRNGP